jgi:hypothetical protein
MQCTSRFGKTYSEKSMKCQKRRSPTRNIPGPSQLVFMESPAKAPRRSAYDRASCWNHMTFGECGQCWCL